MVLNVLAPDIGIFAAIALVLLLFGLVADGMGTTMNLIGNDLTSDQMTQPRRDALRRFARRGRPHWERRRPTTPTSRPISSGSASASAAACAEPRYTF